ncbi:MAG: hypothetical protein ACLFR1_01155 [Spirochaetia bacterium]
MSVRRVIIFFLLILFLSSVPGYSYRILYAEQFYRLYHRHFTMYPEDCLENIYYLEQALRADFANPLNAVARDIETPQQWERYRYLFSMHVNLKLVELYLMLGSKYDKFHAYFYNAPFRRQNLESLEIAQESYEYALVYWEEALSWAEQAWSVPYFHLEEIQYWEDESTRIYNGDLDYGEIINDHLDRLESVRRAFEEMDEDTY